MGRKRNAKRYKKRPKKIGYSFKKKAIIVIPPSMRTQQIHRFTRYSSTLLELIPSNNGNTFVPYQKTFTLNDIVAPAEFTNLFDQYKIHAVSVQITPAGQFITNDRSVTGAAGSDAEGLGYWVPPMLYAVIDINDSAALGSINEALEYSTCKMIPYRKTYTKFYFTPGMNYDVALDAATTARTGTKYAQWLSTTNTNIEHYGMKFLVMNNNANNVASSFGTCRYLVRTKYYILCKNVR